MTREEAITTFLEKKQSEGLSNSSIRSILRTDYNFSDQEIKEILVEISDRELDQIQHRENNPLAFLESKYVSYFFLLFSIVAIIVSIRYIQGEPQNQMEQFLPWVMILGALFLIYKHGYRIFRK